ncbi:hypothetical protein K493DRAFT_347260 [Basidiobolus meristosporus CBS 931.73]|uniref:Uncharacterized protein n=1 Tax=Basidiobolus meristosporus CBS 931.73 TaxID=1314790 RepID=A0A1Y1YTW1_9FUNG|nr:hypothetical protein K493DRAFT_347260 [Basidiobolus meristosporus CBS 931.73]|eukprot:ORY01470.1 hypothetical protein K493DRAFT_347260 [Basidiobolus meristosporus CBS 931.73]
MNATLGLKALNKELLTRLMTTPMNRVSALQTYAMERFSPASSLLVSMFCRDAAEELDRVKMLAPMEFLQTELPLRLCQNVKLLNSRFPLASNDGHLNARIRQVTFDLLEDISILTDLPAAANAPNPGQLLATLKLRVDAQAAMEVPEATVLYLR